MTARELVVAAHNYGVNLFVLDGRLKAHPAGALPAELKAAIRESAAEVIALLSAEQERTLADQALELLNRLKGYTVPAGKMPAARELARQMQGLIDPARMLAALQDLERELVALGGEYDSQLAEAVAMVEQAFPGARLLHDR